MGSEFWSHHFSFLFWVLVSLVIVTKFILSHVWDFLVGCRVGRKKAVSCSLVTVWHLCPWGLCGDFDGPARPFLRRAAESAQLVWPAAPQMPSACSDYPSILLTPGPSAPVASPFPPPPLLTLTCVNIPKACFVSVQTINLEMMRGEGELCQPKLRKYKKLG